MYSFLGGYYETGVITYLVKVRKKKKKNKKRTGRLNVFKQQLRNKIRMNREADSFQYKFLEFLKDVLELEFEGL